MSPHLTPPAQWAQAEFGFAQLGDQRRNQRLVNIAEHLAASPGGTLPQAFPHWAELKAACRFFGQRGVTFERVAGETGAQAQRVVGYYTARRWIEEYHKALKSGAGVEASQLARADRLEPLIAVRAVVAVRLLSTKLLARSRPESGEAAASFGPTLLALLEQKLGPPKGGWTNQNLIRAVARVGGFIGRKSDGQPGWQTIWRGWQRLMWMREGVETLQRT